MTTYSEFRIENIKDKEDKLLKMLSKEELQKKDSKN